MKLTLRIISLTFLGWGTFFPHSIFAQIAEPFAYPSEGQSPEQQQQDHAACYTWARQQTNISPSNLSPQTIRKKLIMFA